MDNQKKETFAGLECANCTATKCRAGQPIIQKCARCQLVAYCSRECQVQHWKRGNHQKWCLTPKERSVQQLAKKGDHESAPGLNPEAASCPICLELIVLAKTDLNKTLACSHVFHVSCIEGLRSHALQQACPLCRADLPSQSGASTTTRCANCGNERCPDGAPLAHCADCKLVFYCGRDCQRAHWKNGGHKAICAQATAQRIAKDTLQALNKALDSRGTTQLCVAAVKNQTAKVQQLLDQGAAVNKATTDDGTTPLYMAALQGHAEVVRLLIGSGAAVNQATTDNGTTPLLIAAVQGHAKVVRLLIDGGASVNQAMRNSGEAPLFVAAAKGHAEVAGLLVGGGAAVNQATTDYGFTPLFVAAQEGHADVVSLLIGGGAAVNQTTTDNYGTTPLYVAAMQGHAEVARLLVVGGAAVNQATMDDGTTPLDIAAQKGHTNIMTLLVEHGATTN